MVSIKKEESAGGQIRFKISGLVTVCPFTNKEDKRDVSEIKITYKPGKYKISESELEDFIKKEIKDKEIAMEMIPVKILEFFIEHTVMEKPASRMASPELIEINTTSKGKGKTFTISTKLKFEKEVSQIPS